MTILNSTCKGKRLLVACRRSTDEKTLTVAGIGEREDLLSSCTSMGYCYTTLKNNTAFYYQPNKAWGFEGRPEVRIKTLKLIKDFLQYILRSLPQLRLIMQFQPSFSGQTTQPPLFINPCDNSNEYSQYRLCWSLRSNPGGDRCGSSKNIRNTNEWERLIYQAVLNTFINITLISYP